MNTNTNTNTNNTKPSTAKRPAGYTKADWDNKTFRVYNGLVKLVKNEISLSQFVNHPIVKELCNNCGITTGMSDKEAVTTRGQIVVSLLISMAKDRTSHGEKERHIAPIYRLRSFFNGDYKGKAELPVTYKEPKAPKAPATKKATKKSTVRKVQNQSIEDWAKGLTADQKAKIIKAIAA